MTAAGVTMPMLSISDVRHHAEQKVHRHVRFQELGTDGPYQQTTRIAGIWIAEELVLTRAADGTITNEAVSGPNCGGRLVVRFNAEGRCATRVDVTLDVVLPARGGCFVRSFASSYAALWSVRWRRIGSISRFAATRRCSNAVWA